MATADRLLELMFSWIEQRERCAKQLRKLAQELESLREKCNGSECVGSSVSVVGAACLFGAGVATFFTGGAAAPLLGVVGTACSVGGATISLVTKIIEHFSSSDTMKEAQEIEKKSNGIADKIQKLFKQLKAEMKEKSSSADPDELDQHIMTEILGAMARQSGLKGEFGIRMLDNEPQFFFNAGSRNMGVNMIFNPEVIAPGLAGILTFFTFQAGGKKFKLLFAKWAKQLIKQTGFKIAFKGGAKIVGGVVGLAFELPEAIDNWKEMIKKNHVTEASQSLRDTADTILKISRTLREQFNDMKKMLDKMAKHQRELEEKPEMLNKDNNRSSNPPQQKSRNQKTQRKEDEQEGDQTEPDRGEQDEEKGSEAQGGGDQGDEEGDGEDEDSDQEDEESDSEEETEEDVGGQSSPAAIRLACLNVRSMNNKISKIKKTSRILEVITQDNRDVFLTTETWLQRENAYSVLREASPPNFSFHYQVRGRRGGGVAIQFSNQLQGEEMHFGFFTTFEYVATVLQHDEWDEPVLIINVYHPPRYRVNEFLNEFQKLLDIVNDIYNSIIVTGDFNIWVDDETNPSTVRFNTLLRSNGLVQHVRGPTHRRGHTLDLVITRNVEISDLIVWDYRIADHYSINFSAKPVSKDLREKTKESMDQDEQTKRFRKKEE